jgi:hypothetical protein
MCDQMPRKSNDTPADAPQPITVEHLRRAADSWRDLSDPVLMAKAWDEPAASDVQPPKNAPRRLGQLQNLSVPDTFDESLPDTELAAGEDDSPWQAPGGHPVSRRHYVTVTQCLRISSTAGAGARVESGDVGYPPGRSPRCHDSVQNQRRSERCAVRQLATSGLSCLRGFSLESEALMFSRITLTA